MNTNPNQDMEYHVFVHYPAKKFSWNDPRSIWQGSADNFISAGELMAHIYRYSHEHHTNSPPGPVSDHTGTVRTLHAVPKGSINIEDDRGPSDAFWNQPDTVKNSSIIRHMKGYDNVGVRLGGRPMPDHANKILDGAPANHIWGLEA